MKQLRGRRRSRLSGGFGAAICGVAFNTQFTLVPLSISGGGYRRERGFAVATGQRQTRGSAARPLDFWFGGRRIGLDLRMSGTGSDHYQ